ncbi:MAG: trypsin-like peptidase domain-containing protein [Chloroflexi bacterium]|nr:trypsin-like peptidase domain-containing protein [Chloroflexota bacterium]MDA1271874.1 trypsin-like peptidase domain-containing protein [Chloroflexota bacterium]
MIGLLLFVLAACGGSAATQAPDAASGAANTTQVSDTGSAGGTESEAAPVLQRLTADEIVAAQETVMARIYQTALPAVVNIQVIQGLEGNEGTGPFVNPPEDFLQRGEGSGFVWDDKGRIVTNQHVVEGAETVTVVFADRTQVLAKVLGGDVDSDLAVLELQEPIKGLAPIELGDSGEVQVGQLAIAIGAPFGQTFTMTSGIVSAVGRTMRSGSSQFTVPEVIQTDAPINPGNSGGPLLDRRGRVVGINTQILSRSGGNAGVGLAVPINIAKKVVPALIADGKYEYSWLGISGAPVSPDVAQLMELPKGTQGALVISVSDDSPAFEAGLTGSDRTETVNGIRYALGGDTITGINGSKIRDMTDLIVYLTNNTRPGDEVMLEVIHQDGSTDELPVVLGTRPGKVS